MHSGCKRAQETSLCNCSGIWRWAQRGLGGSGRLARRPPPTALGLAIFALAAFALATFALAAFALATFALAAFALATFALATFALATFALATFALAALPVAPSSAATGPSTSVALCRLGTLRWRAKPLLLA